MVNTLPFSHFLIINDSPESLSDIIQSGKTILYYHNNGLYLSTEKCKMLVYELFTCIKAAFDLFIEGNF